LGSADKPSTPTKQRACTPASEDPKSRHVARGRKARPPRVARERASRDPGISLLRAASAGDAHRPTSKRNGRAKTSVWMDFHTPAVVTDTILLFNPPSRFSHNYLSNPQYIYTALRTPPHSLLYPQSTSFIANAHTHSSLFHSNISPIYTISITCVNT
jgi:hypothetical protein